MSKSAVVFFACLALLVLHQDLWFWDDDQTLLLGFLPVGLAYHAVYSVVVAVFWWWAAGFAWPKDWEETAESSSEDSKRD